MSIGDDAYLTIERLLGNCGAEVSASEADGRLLSLAAMLGNEAISVWVQQLFAQADGGEHGARQALVEFAAQRIAILEAGEGLPDLCLPDDEDDIRDRVGSLALWATGYLNGLGEGAALRGSPAREILEAEPLAELLADLAEISRAAIEADEISEAEDAHEADYAELVEFLRVAAQLSYETLTSIRAITDGGEAKVH
ncbi:MAG: UPF0149 family protein [Pseudomonadota bacterium]